MYIYWSTRVPVPAIHTHHAFLRACRKAVAVLPRHLYILHVTCYASDRYMYIACWYHAKHFTAVQACQPPAV